LNIRRVSILGAQIDNLTINELLDRIVGIISLRTPCFIITANVDHLIVRRKDKKFENAYKNARLVVPDGMPLVWASKFLGNPIKERITGTDLLMNISELSAEKGYSIFLLGAAKGVAEKLGRVLQDKYPKLRIVGISSPRFGFEKDRIENEKVMSFIRDKSVDILFTALGSPKGEKWIRENYRSLNVTLSLNIGAVFDFVAGKIARAPLWIQRCGFEWLWRLIKEPRRLWKRYLLRDMTFFYLVLKQRVLKKD